MKNLQQNLIKNKCFNCIMKIAAWISDLPNKLTPAPFRLMQIGSLFWQSRALYITVKLGIADEMCSAPKSSLELANQLGLHEPHLYRLLRFMAAMGVFKEVKHKHFVHNKLSLPLARAEKNNVCDMILMHNSSEMTLPWMDAMQASIKNGGTPFVQYHGSDLFTYMDNNQPLNTLFSNAMNTVESLTGLEYLQDFDWSAFDRIIDLGGSKGSKSLAILAEHAHLSAVVFDRTEVVKGAKDYWKEIVSDQVLKRVDYVGGDLFSSILPEAKFEKDLYLLIAVFHLLDDAQAITLINRICDAMGHLPATIAIVDAILPEQQASFTDASFDMQMLMGTMGRERTLNEWNNIFNLAEVELVASVEIRTFAQVMVLKQK
ncbi:MAG: hypothetical protein OFPI_12270 [Osedax symbiont Rs2]|nr:MAG: hypothetical protein OFPI_12270 [Osedax symbiont Rs2]